MEKRKVALVTGASRGIGKATAIKFAEKNIDVVINYNSSCEEAKELEKYINHNFKINTLAIKADVSNEVEVKLMVEKAINTFGKIDILVNNAGIAIELPFEEKEVKHWQKTLDVNLIGTFLVSKYVSKYMIENKYGKIINVSSNNGINCFSPFIMDYDASKAGVIALTHNLAIQLQPYVNVNAVAPGWVKTDMNKEFSDEFVKEQSEKVYLKRFAEPEEIANVIAFLASDDASYINSEIIKIDGGY